MKKQVRRQKNILGGRWFDSNPRYQRFLQAVRQDASFAPVLRMVFFASFSRKIQGYNYVLLSAFSFRDFGVI